MFTEEEWQLIEMRVDDSDWDASQRYDVWLLLKKALKEHKAAQYQAPADGAWVCVRCGHNATSKYCSNCDLPFPPRR